jgi:hypothetical protein
MIFMPLLQRLVLAAVAIAGCWAMILWAMQA